MAKDPSNWYRADEIENFHREFSKWNGSKHAFSFMGGRVALSACIYALELKASDEVILPGYTCIVVPNAFNFEGIKIIYSDIELDTYGLDASQIEEKITSKTKVILLHHLYGLVCRDYEKIISIARKRNLYVIEDCAQGTGAKYNDINVGNLGDVSIYSGEQSKVFNTIQGGIVTTNNDAIARKIAEYYDKAPFPDEILINKQLCSFFINYYSFKDPQRWWKRKLIRHKYKDKIIISTTKEEMQGIRPSYYGSKMPTPIASIGINQLRKVDRYNQIRRNTAKKWAKWCDNNNYKKPVVIPNSLPIFLRYPVMVEPEKKQNKVWAEKELGVDLGVWFISNIHPVPNVVEGCPNANKAVKQCINFPTILQ